MSLLLDALKRAEEAKRAKGQEGQQPGGGVGVTKAEAPPAFEELSLEALENYAKVPAEVAPLQPPPTKLVMDFTKDMPSGRQTAEAPPPAPSSRAGADTVSTLPTARLVRQDFSLRATADSPADESAQRETAKNVFAAKQGAQSKDQSARGKWLLPLIAFLVVGLGSAGWYVWNEVTRISRGAPSALAVRPVPSPSSTLAPASQSIGQAGVKVTETGSAAVTQALPPLLPPPAKEAALPRAVVTRSGADSGYVLSERELLAKSLKDASGRAPKEAPVSLKLSQTINAPRVNPEVLAAYAALSKGDYAQARQRYEQVVEAEPFNLDAHLGLAAAAARSGENTLAARHYRRALELDPRNGAALAGMLAVSSTANPQALEIELKTLIGKDPNSAALQFSLGNLYAGDRRWSEAQQAYFEAYRLESENADYRYNLAVALDQMKQSKLALDYYQKALAQATRSGAQFDRVAVQRRIGELKAP